MILRVWLRLQWHKVECPLPILLPTTLAVWLLSFIVTFREFTPPTILEGADSMMLGPLLWRYVASTDIQRRVLELRSHPGRSQAVVIDSALSKRSGGQGRAPALQSSYAKPAAVLARGAVIAVIARPH
jgi:hypothetical protein